MLVVTASAKKEPERRPIVVTLAGTQPSADPRRFEEAIGAWRAKTAMSEADWQALTEAQRQRAFKVAGVTNLRLLSDVWNALDRAVEKGETLADFKAGIAAKLEKEWGGEKPGRLETIFRTNVQTAYSHGRYAQQTTPAMLKRRPFWKYSAVNDSRTTPICQPLGGTVLPASDPFWNTHVPPLHFNCRSTIIALSRDAAEAQGIAEDAPDIDAAEGFGLAPRPGTDTFAPDLSNVPPPLAKAYLAKQHKTAAPAKVTTAQAMADLDSRSKSAARAMFGADFDNLPPVASTDGTGNSYRDPTTGAIEIGATYWPHLVTLAQKKPGQAITHDEARGLEAYFHESIHGLGTYKQAGKGGWEALLYSQGIGRVLEEGSTELLAVLKTHDFARELGYVVPPEAGYYRTRASGTLKARHSYYSEVGTVETLLHFAAGSAKPTIIESGDLDSRGVALLVEMAGHWQPRARLKRLADAAFERYSTPGDVLREQRRALFESIVVRSSEDDMGQGVLHSALWHVLHGDEATLKTIASHFKVAL